MGWLCVCDSDTWEPIHHLAGCEEFIARFNKEREAKNQEAREALQEKARLKREEARAAELEKAALIAKNAATVEEKLVQKGKSRRVSEWWNSEHLAGSLLVQ